jgi:plastocyanin
MPRSRRFALATLTVIALVASIGCSSEKSTNPPFVSGPTFNLTFTTLGKSDTLRFITVGSWNYRCIPHASAGMNGTVVVDAGSSNDSALVQIGPSDAFVFQPTSVTIRPGGLVRWVNMSSMTNHTVTR